ncbi:MAG: single-stranded DNA-binding protein [bacterium]|nr:single-stranded DNA-binding protein [bacterium]
MDINKAIIVGRLTRDPEARTTPGGINVTQISVATNFVYKNQEGQKIEQVEYHNVVVWRKLAEIAAQYLKKGRRVLIEGRLQTRSWESNDGTKRQRTEIVGDNLIMLDSSGGQSGQGGARTNPQTEETPTILVEQPANQPAANSNPDDISVEDIPF